MSGKTDAVPARNIALDAIKGLCIVLMVIAHSGAPRWLVIMISTFHMPIFFMISGFLLKPKYITDLKTFTKRKFKTIWWPYAKWTIIFVILHNVFTSLNLYDTAYSLKEILMRILKGLCMSSTEQLLGGFWFLAALMFASVVSIIYLKIAGTSRISIISGILGSLGLAWIMTIPAMPKIPYFNPANLLSTSFFLTGFWIATENLHVISRKWPVIVGGIAALGIGSIWIQSAVTNVTYITILPYYISASVISWSLIVLFWRVRPESNWKYVVKIGSRTLDILIFHFLAFKIVTWFRVWFFGLDQAQMSQFPVIDFRDVQLKLDFYWIIYSIIGIGIPLLLSYAKDMIRERVKKRKS